MKMNKVLTFWGQIGESIGTQGVSQMNPIVAKRMLYIYATSSVSLSLYVYIYIYKYTRTAS